MYYQKRMTQFMRPQIDRYLATFRPGQRIKVSNLLPEPPPMDYHQRQRWAVSNYEAVVVSSSSQKLVVKKDNGCEWAIYPSMGLTISKVNVPVVS